MPKNPLASRSRPSVREEIAGSEVWISSSVRTSPCPGESGASRRKRVFPPSSNSSKLSRPNRSPKVLHPWLEKHAPKRSEESPHISPCRFSYLCWNLTTNNGETRQDGSPRSARGVIRFGVEAMAGQPHLNSRSAIRFTGTRSVPANAKHSVKRRPNHGNGDCQAIVKKRWTKIAGVDISTICIVIRQYSLHGGGTLQIYTQGDNREMVRCNPDAV